MPTFKLLVAVQQARNLKSRDFNGLADPFVTANIKGVKYPQNQKTAVVNKSLTPSWNQQFSFLLNADEAQFSQLRLRVWDKDFIGESFMGELNFPAYKIQDNFDSAQDKWYPLLDKSGGGAGHHGEILLRIGISGDNLPSSSEERLNILMQTATVHDSMEEHESAFDHKEVSGANVSSIDGLLSFEVLKATDLPNTGNDFVPFNCDAFFVVSYGVNTFKSRVIKHNLNPEWDDRVLLLVRERDRNYQIKVSIYDHDVLGSNKLIGSSQIVASEFTSKKAAVEKTLKLELAHPVPPDNAKIVVRGNFLPYHDLKKQMWLKLATNFDLDHNQKINHVEFHAMLDMLGTTLSDDEIGKLFKKYGTQDPTTNEIEILPENIVTAMDEVAKDPTKALITLDKNPFNGKPLSKNSEEAIIQLAVSCAQDFAKLDQFIVGGLISEAYASKGWFSHVTSYLTRGRHKLGADDANILVQDRRSGLVIEEKIPSFVRLGIRVLYQNGSKASLEGLNSKAVRNLFINQSIRQGLEYDNPKSAEHILPFAKFHNLNLAEDLDPVESYKNFNEFFYRKLKPDARVAASPDPRVFISPADCRCTVFPTITQATELWIKSQTFTVGRLFADDEMGKEYENGALCIFRLAPQDYHRYHSPCNGTFRKLRDAGQHLFTVNPMAIRENFPVYTENKRYVCTIETKEYGKVAYIIVGAMLVGTINLTVKETQDITRLQELGYFAFGGSTIICVFQPNKIKLDGDLVENSSKCLETLIRVGDSIGTAV